jgi:hypothetical protein
MVRRYVLITQIIYLLLLLVNVRVFALELTTIPVIKRIRDVIAQTREFITGSPNPCYHRKRTQPSAELCKDVTLPNGFCDTCGVNSDVHSDGSYGNCLYASDVETMDGTINMACLDMMDLYVNMNPCDTQRASGLSEFRNMLWLPHSVRRLRTKSRQTLDSFVYAVCEAACDCIPQYNASLSLDERAYDVHRGNCQGHLFHDVCQVYPNIKVIRGGNGSSAIAQISDISTISPVCPYISDWRANNPGEWFNLTPTTVDPISHAFIDGLIEATEIISSTNGNLWRSCYALESKQHRIVPRS